MKRWPIIKQVLALLDFLYHAFIQSYDKDDIDKDPWKRDGRNPY